MSTITTTDHELSIPGHFVALFRLAVIDEVEDDANWIKEQTAEVSEFYAADDDPDDPDEDPDERPKILDVHLADLSGPIRSLADDHAMLERIARHTPWPGRDLTIQGGYATLHGALQATIRRAAKNLVAACEYSPIDGGRIVHGSSAAIWAAEQIERLSEAMGGPFDGSDGEGGVMTGLTTILVENEFAIRSAAVSQIKSLALSIADIAEKHIEEKHIERARKDLDLVRDYAEQIGDLHDVVSQVDGSRAERELEATILREDAGEARVADVAEFLDGLPAEIRPRIRKALLYRAWHDDGFTVGWLVSATPQTLWSRLKSSEGVGCEYYAPSFSLGSADMVHDALRLAGLGGEYE